jgi:hypothetical protein
MLFISSKLHENVWRIPSIQAIICHFFNAMVLQEAVDASFNAILYSPEFRKSSPTNLLDQFISARHQLLQNSETKDKKSNKRKISEINFMKMLQDVTPPLDNSYIGILMEDYFRLLSSKGHQYSAEDLLQELDRLLLIYTTKEFPIRRSR